MLAMPSALVALMVGMQLVTSATDVQQMAQSAPPDSRRCAAPLLPVVLHRCATRSNGASSQPHQAVLEARVR